MDTADAFSRAKRKLADLKGGAVRCFRTESPLARQASLLFGLVFLGLVMGAVATVSIMTATNGRPNPQMEEVQVPLIGGSALMTVALFGGAIGIVARALQNSPKAALRNFYELVGSGQNASSWVVPNDLDQSERALPELKGLGQAGSAVICDGASMAAYWCGLLWVVPDPVVTMGMSQFELRQIDSNVAVAKFDLGIKVKPRQPNSATIQVIEGLVALIGLDVKYGATFRVSKILYRSELGWRLFNAEFMGPEELDYRWLERPDEPFGH